MDPVMRICRAFPKVKDEMWSSLKDVMVRSVVKYWLVFVRGKKNVPYFHFTFKGRYCFHTASRLQNNNVIWCESRTQNLNLCQPPLAIHVCHAFHLLRWVGEVTQSILGMSWFSNKRLSGGAAVSFISRPLIFFCSRPASASSSLLHLSFLIWPHFSLYPPLPPRYNPVSEKLPSPTRLSFPPKPLSHVWEHAGPVSYHPVKRFLFSSSSVFFFHLRLSLLPPRAPVSLMCCAHISSLEWARGGNKKELGERGLFNGWIERRFSRSISNSVSSHV